ncbi:unnamed protein product [Lactuca virosa]|uniref:Uncharacterized protein n=1 Tax=Lactuca virosa TaxID=75947 RepID=A0AAU9MUY7_9ASTR|nr:unnamed protein product [Lactuca virosa]
MPDSISIGAVSPNLFFTVESISFFNLLPQSVPDFELQQSILGVNKSRLEGRGTKRRRTLFRLPEFDIKLASEF